MAELEVVRLNSGHALPLESKPNGISFQWVDSAGDPVDMTTGTWTGQGRAEAVEGTPAANLGAGIVSVVTGTATATYAWHDDDHAAVGVFRLIIWVGNLTKRYGSHVFEWAVADAPGAAPTV